MLHDADGEEMKKMQMGSYTKGFLMDDATRNSDQGGHGRGDSFFTRIQISDFQCV
jgi:hypothetical protein